MSGKNLRRRSESGMGWFLLGFLVVLLIYAVAANQTNEAPGRVRSPNGMSDPVVAQQILLGGLSLLGPMTAELLLCD